MLVYYTLFLQQFLFYIPLQRRTKRLIDTIVQENRPPPTPIKPPTPPPPPLPEEPEEEEEEDIFIEEDDDDDDDDDDDELEFDDFQDDLIGMAINLSRLLFTEEKPATCLIYL